ncbi:MAG: hypothetical protein K1X53_17255 [Candidatus Sumerlaeaceae bacterium]|nr:hypothetical protein [Candidatus Sumerlaeaceae bacterium]
MALPCGANAGYKLVRDNNGITYLAYQPTLLERVASIPRKFVNIQIFKPNTMRSTFGGAVSQRDMEKRPNPVKAAQNTVNQTANTVEKVTGLSTAGTLIRKTATVDPAVSVSIPRPSGQ